MAWQVYRTHFLLCETVPLFPGPYPGVRRSRRRKPGPRSLGTAAHQGKALAVEVLSTEEQARFTECLRHPCDPTSLRAEKRTEHTPSSTAGWIPQGGGRPRLWRFFPRFLIGEKSGPAERPRLGRRFVPVSLKWVNLSTKKVEEPSIGSSTSLMLRIDCAQS